MWHNGSTPEEVLDENGKHLGVLNPYEAATPLYKKNGMTHVVYNTDKGPNTKSGYVKYEGSALTRVDIPKPSITNTQKIVYGTSGRGRELAAYKVGNGVNSLIYVCAIHGWEDHWAADGIELTRIGNGLIEHFQNASTNNWSLYIIPLANPDGLSEGFTNNGPGRCTIVGQQITEGENKKNITSTYTVTVYVDEAGNMVIIKNPTIDSKPQKANYEPVLSDSDGTVDAVTTEEINSFLDTFFKLYPTATEKEPSYYVSNQALDVINKDYVFVELVNPVYTQADNQVTVTVTVKYLDKETKVTQLSQFELTLQKNENWKIIE